MLFGSTPTQIHQPCPDSQTGHWSLRHLYITDIAQTYAEIPAGPVPSLSG